MAQSQGTRLCSKCSEFTLHAKHKTSAGEMLIAVMLAIVAGTIDGTPIAFVVVAVGIGVILFAESQSVYRCQRCGQSN